MAASQYSENLFTAIDTIVKARMDELAYDKTVVCAIADITDRIRGKYLVTDGSSIFTAYSKYLEYELD
jgi:hypothetical protein